MSLIAVIGVILVSSYELWAFYTDKTKTISYLTWVWVTRYPIIAFVAGFVMGHLFWQNQKVYLGLCK